MADPHTATRIRREKNAKTFIGKIVAAYTEPDMVIGCIIQPGAVRACAKCVAAKYIGKMMAPDYELILEGRSGRRATITMNAYHANTFDTWREALNSN